MFSDEKRVEKSRRLLMLLWKNYGEKRPAAIQLIPIRPPVYQDSDRIAAQVFPLLFPSCFSHKTMKGRL
jgi:hypothetical protein